MFRIICFLSLLLISDASAQNCTTDGNRLGGLQTSIIQALNTGQQPGHAYMIYGRYNPLRANLMKEGFGMIMGTGHRDFRDCDESSFWSAVNQVIPSTDENRQKYAKELVNDPSAPPPPTPLPPQPNGTHCRVPADSFFHTPARTCTVQPQPIGNLCFCGGPPDGHVFP